MNMVSRTGDRRELLKGPASYGIVITFATLVWWRSVPALFSIVVLCMGDGASGLFGPIFGKRKLLWNRSKSLEGSVAFFVFSLLSVVLIHHLFIFMGWTPIPFTDSTMAMVYYGRVSGAVLLCTVVESLPIKDWDNVTVFITSALVSHII